MHIKSNSNGIIYTCEKACSYTHNANIPVLGDAEKVLAIEFQDTKIDVSQGNIDLNTTHNQIVGIMEGGTEAFERRKMIYTSWQ